MNAGRYSNRQRTGDHHIGNIPLEWSAVRLKFVARLKYGDSLESSLRNDTGNIAVFGSNGQVGSHDTANTRGPVIVIGRKGSYGSVQYSTEPVFAIDTTYFIDESVCRADLRWLYYALQIVGLNEVSQDTGVPGLSRDSAYQSLLPLPTLAEQSEIADFLDRETAKADALVAKYDRLIELLEEKRAALVMQAVTKGLNPDAPMKDSGFEFIGLTPAHWEIRRLKFLARIRYGLGQPPEFQDGGLPFIRATNIDNGEILQHNMVYVNAHDVPVGREAILKSGDIILVRSGALTGDSAIVPDSYHGAIAGYDIIVSALVPKTSPFIAWSLLGAHIREYQLGLAKMRAAQPHINAEEVGSLCLACPPVEEQIAIANYLRLATSKLDALRDQITQAIRFAAEHRSALITAAVTGQIDVRTYKAKDLEEVVA